MTADGSASPPPSPAPMRRAGASPSASPRSAPSWSSTKRISRPTPSPSPPEAPACASGWRGRPSSAPCEPSPAPRAAHPAVLASIEEALLQAFGDPKRVPAGVELRTDHGPQYTGADCAELVTRWRLLHTFAPVGRPTGNAVAERVIRTMKEEVIWLRDWRNAAELREALLAWQVRYNTQRPHQALGWKTPAEYRAEKLGLAVEVAA